MTAVSNHPDLTVRDGEGYGIPQKRQCPEQCQYLLTGAPQPQPKRQKTSHRTIKTQPPAEFWDNLSKIWLSGNALRELDRRTAQSVPSPPHPSQRIHRPLTRSVLAKYKGAQQPTQSAPAILSRYIPERLRDIKLFARHGGPDLSDLKGYPEPVHPPRFIMDSSRSTFRRRNRGSISIAKTKSTKTATTKSTGPYDRNFQQNLIDGGVYPHAYTYPDGRTPAKPRNWEEINIKLAQPRPSLSPSKFSERAHEDFVQADANAFKEKQITASVIPIIAGDVTDARCVSGGIPFTNLEHLTDGTLVPGNPDVYYGARPEQLERCVRDELSGYIIPSTQDDLPIAPNFFLAVKGPEGTGAVARRQASYDGALGARAFHSLQSYGQHDAICDDSAYTITSTYNDGQLKMYTSHSIQPAETTGQPQYYMNQLKGWSMTSDLQTFRQGAAAFRNARDWAKEKRDEAIARASEKANATYGDIEVATLAESVVVQSMSQTSEATQNELSSMSKNDQRESETSMDELALDANTLTTGPSKSYRSRERKRNKSVVSRRQNSEATVTQQASDRHRQRSYSNASKARRPSQNTKRNDDKKRRIAP